MAVKRHAGGEEPSSSVWRPRRLFMAPGTMQATSLTLSIKLSDLLLPWLQSGTMKRNGELYVLYAQRSRNKKNTTVKHPHVMHDGLRNNLLLRHTKFIRNLISNLSQPNLESDTHSFHTLQCKETSDTYFRI